MPGTPPRRLRVVGLGHRRRRSAGRTFTLTLPEFSGAAGALPRLRGGRPSHLHLGVLAETAPPTQDAGPSPRVSHSHGEAQVCTRLASLEASPWLR